MSGEDEHTGERIAALLFALARTVFCGYRAATQSITVDEATTYLQYARGHWAAIWSNYDANNHILYSILAHLSVRAFHISDFTLRLPSVLAGFFFTIGVYRVLEETVASRAIRWIALAGLCAAPLLLDFSVAARGYGLSLALLVWAIFFFLRGREVSAGVFLGLSVAANFNIAFPALGLIAYPFFLAEGSLEKRLRRTLPIGLSAAAVFLAICGPVLLQMKAGNFYVGEASIRTALYELVFTFIRATPGHPGWFGGGDGAHAAEYVFLPAVLLFTIAISARAFWKKQGSPRALAPAFALVLALAAIACAHIFAGFNYPVDRMGLYLFLLLGLAWAGAGSLVQDRRVRAVNAVLAILLIAQFLTQLHSSFLALWIFDAPMKRMAQRIGEEVRRKQPGSVSVSAGQYHTPALEYYRDIYRLSALKPIERRDPTLLQGFDYYVLDGDINTTPEALRLTPIFKDDLSGVLLAREP